MNLWGNTQQLRRINDNILYYDNIWFLYYIVYNTTFLYFHTTNTFEQIRKKRVYVFFPETNSRNCSNRMMKYIFLRVAPLHKTLILYY
jgi:hypothetical protein